jgi:hypothetical protein
MRGVLFGTARHKMNVFFYKTTHVETVVLLSHKNADTHINVNVEFGKGDGKIPVGKIAEKADSLHDVLV